MNALWRQRLRTIRARFFGMFLASKAARRRTHQYALAILHRSMALHSNNPMQLDPASARHVGLSSNPADHVRFGYAIITAYAVLEQLGLEVRASQGNPSFINGAWNPTLEARWKHA